MMNHQSSIVNRESAECVQGWFDGVEVRAIDEDGRTATFVAATENGVETYWGREYLRMSGAKLDRYRKNPVLLDTHDRYQAGGVIGKAKKVTIKNRELVVDVLFAETVRADEIFALVRDGFLNALSIGFIPVETQVLAEGETSGAGKNRIEGPARVVTEWELYEVSVVPVPADAETLRRSFLQTEQTDLLSATRRLVETLEHTKLGDVQMNESKKTPAPAESETASDEANVPKSERAAAPAPTETELKAREIRAICPAGLEELAETCILENLSVDKARERLLAEHTKRTKPVGTGEPMAPQKEQAGKDKGSKLADVSNRDLAASLCD